MQPRTIGISGKTIVIRHATVDELIPLRHRILREGLPVEEAHFEGDDAPTARHAGAFVDGVAICCATLMLDQWEGERAWRLRGMATEPAMQRSGVGRIVLEFLTDWVLTDPPAEAKVHDKPLRLFW